MPHKHALPSKQAGTTPKSRIRRPGIGRRVARRLLIVGAVMLALIALAGAANAVFISSTASGTVEDLVVQRTHVPPAPKTPTPPAPVGAAPVGDAAYPIPVGALFVAPGGADSAAGTRHAPFRTLGHAVAVAHTGDTIVLRGGSYHESVAIQQKLTIQSYPHEAVWLDGSSRVSGWSATGKR
ncbi:MAG TPA: DUF1565 domain-containing protein, partial [Mycobacteriales bacterium]|nr:DUF1565 domain-containing protein [Mycobacteriales bacterium]